MRVELAESAPAAVRTMAEFRRALGRFATGVTVVTTREADGTPGGATANSFTSVSLDPMLVLVCIGTASKSLSTIRRSKFFAVNVLGAEQQSQAASFASKRADKFAAIGWTTGRTGALILSDCLAWFDGRVHEIVPAGDHEIVIGAVDAFDRRDGAPLAFHDGRYARIDDVDG